MGLTTVKVYNSHYESRSLELDILADTGSMWVERGIRPIEKAMFENCGQ
ncbi:hypothetical protein KEJ25_09415 [Candidatus Bathyarchaeota archaeon]|nr:hypothetical protein [Candidatus Bathyarchaeota archaeon]